MKKKVGNKIGVLFSVVGKKGRKLDIGPGFFPIPEFESIDLVDHDYVTHVADATDVLPFDDNVFEIVHASHILEHVAWYDVEKVLKEWVRILNIGGQLEIWVPDAYKICQAIIDYENEVPFNKYNDWFHLNPRKDFYLWACGRIFGYGKNNKEHYTPHQWHYGLFTPKSLFHHLQRAGLTDITRMNKDDIRGHDHGWINLGMKGTKL